LYNGSVLYTSGSFILTIAKCVILHGSDYQWEPVYIVNLFLDPKPKILIFTDGD